MQKFFRQGGVLIALIFFLVACSGVWEGGNSNSLGTSQDGTLTQNIPPDDYSGLTNPLKNDEETLNEGKKLYQANCVSCHGTGGEGDGPASGGLDPKPKNLAQSQSQLGDDYLYWRISEGGLMNPFNSLMPAWRGLFNEEQIWQIITYIRTMGG
jgi:mono/diheme cytochrome c family protein